MSEARIQLDAQVQVRRDIEANWAAVDPVLRDGEIAYSKDINRIKVGDGARKWSELEYMAGSSASISLDTEMSDTSENAVPNKVIKAYVDGKAKEAQAAAEQYIQDEVLTDYATTKYVGEREEYLVGYAEGLVNDLEKDINGRGYLTSAAMDLYAKKEDIKGFVTKGSTLADYGITDAMQVIHYPYAVVTESNPNSVGYAAWKTTGPYLRIGNHNNYLLINSEMKGGHPIIWVENVLDGAEQGWTRLVDTGYLGTLAIEVAPASPGNTRPTTSPTAFCTYAYNDNHGWAVTGPAMAFPNGYYKALLNVSMHNPSVEDGGTNAYLGIVYGGVQSKWSLILTEHNIGRYALSSNGGTINGSLTVTGGITLGNKTITSWSDFITSDGGTINAGKYLKFGTKASLGVTSTLDGYDKLVVSGLTQMSDLYIKDKLYFENGCTVTFRNWSTGEKETISSFSDLKTILGLKSLAYKDSVAFTDIGSKPTTLSGYGITDAVKWNGAVAEGAFNEMGYGYQAQGWKDAAPAISFGANNLYYSQIQILSDAFNYRSIRNGVATDWFTLVKTTGNLNIDSVNFTSFGHQVLHRNGTDTDTFLNFGARAYGIHAYGSFFRFYCKEGTVRAFGVDNEGLFTFDKGIKLGGETINSWADVRSNWGSSLASVTNANMTMEVVPRVKKEIVTTLNESHTITFNLTVIANTDLEWIIVFKTGSTVPRINIYHPTATLTWQNKENILNKLSPNTTYRIHIDHYLAMYETF